MRPRHCRHVYGLAVLVLLRPTIPLVVSEAVLDANDDPMIGMSAYLVIISFKPQNFCRLRMCRELYHRFVKTTPKPSATKKSKGELVGPPPPPELLGAVDVAAGGATAVLEGIVVDAAEVAIFAIVWTAGLARFDEIGLDRSGMSCN